MDLYSITYLSKYSSCGNAADEEIVSSILSAARERNRQLNVTGVLIFSGDYFGQIIEGHKNTVETLYETISMDHRHKSVTQLSSGPISERRFANWSMAYARVTKVLSEQFKERISMYEMSYAADGAKGLIEILDRIVSENQRTGFLQ